MAPINYFLQKKNFNRVKCFNIDQLDIEDNEEEFSLSKQKNKSKSMKQEYVDNVNKNLKDDICAVSQENWNRIKTNISEFKIHGQHISYEEWKKLLEMLPFRDMLDQKIIKIVVDANNTDKPLMLDTMDTNQDSLCSLLRIFNYPGVPDLDYEVIGYMNMILTKGDIALSPNYPLGLSGWEDEKSSLGLSGWENKNVPYLFWMSFLKIHIPVLLVPKSKIPDDKDDALGRYYSYSTILSEPLILLCPEKIEEAAQSLYCAIRSDSNERDNNSFPSLETCRKVLYAKVLIHEYAHAIMDWSNIPTTENLLVSNAGISSKKNSYQILRTIGEKYMEESLANMITLQYFEVADKANFEIVKDFMLKQPHAYKFGIEQFEANVDWRLWRKNKTALSEEAKAILNKMAKALDESNSVQAKDFNLKFLGLLHEGE